MWCYIYNCYLVYRFLSRFCPNRFIKRRNIGLVWEPDRGHVHPPRSKIPPMVSEAHGCPKYGLGSRHRSFWVQTLFFERFLGLGENQYFAHLAVWEVCICIHNTWYLCDYAPFWYTVFCKYFIKHMRIFKKNNITLPVTGSDKKWVISTKIWWFFENSYKMYA